MKIIIAEIIDEARSTFTTDLSDPCYAKLEMSPIASYGSFQIIRISIEKLMISLIRGISKEKHIDRKVALNKQNDENEIMIRVKTYIENNLSSELNSDSVSAASGLSLSLLNKLFKKYTGKGVGGFVRQRRIRAACLMIRESDNNFTQIAERLGFNSIHYFSRTFKQLMGMTPSQYANSVKAMIGPDKI
jgi:AraC-like DNA-binding protein